MNERTFPEISDFRKESIENFGTLRNTVGNIRNVFGYGRVLWWHSQDKNIAPLAQTKLSGIVSYSVDATLLQGQNFRCRFTFKNQPLRSSRHLSESSGKV